MNLLERLWSEEEGQDLAEYGLLLALVALAAIAAMGLLGSSVSNTFSGTGSVLTSATT